MADIHSESDDECICMGSDEARRSRGPKQGVLFLEPSLMPSPAIFEQKYICSRTQDNAGDTELVGFNNSLRPVSSSSAAAGNIGGCGSPAAAAKRRALENLERQRAQQTEGQNILSSPKICGQPKRQDSRALQKTTCILRPEEKVLDVRRLDFGQQLPIRARGRPAAAGRDASRGQLPPVGDEALWGGAFKEAPAWLPLPDTSVNAQGQKVEWLRHALYGVGTFLDVERAHEYVECVKALGRQRRLKAYGRHEDLREKFQRRPDEWRFWCKGVGGKHFVTKRVKLPKFSRESDFIGLVYPYPRGQLKPEDILLPRESLTGVFGHVKDLRGLLAQEGLKPTSQCTAKVIVSLKEQIIRCMEGRQNFIAVEKCSPTHTVQLAEEEHRERVGLAGQGAPQHFRAVASLGEYDALPVATILGPPYGGVLRPAGELALMQIIHDQMRNIQGPPRQCYAFRIDNLGCIGEWEAQEDRAEARRGLETDIDSEDPENSISGDGLEEAWDGGTKPLASLDEIHNYVQRTMNKLASCRTFEEATQIERDFCMNDPDIRMDGGSSSEPDYPELDAMDYRSEYSMMNDAHGSSNVGDVNNCHTLMVIIAGLPFFFPVTNRPVRNGEELLLSYGPHYWTGNQSLESFLSATFLQMKAMLNLSFQNKRDEIGRAEDVRDGTVRLDKSLADERAAADVVELLERLHLCEGLTEQRTRAREWVVELRDRLHQEGRGQAVLGALDKTVKSLSRGDDLSETFARLKATTERLSMDYKRRTLELQEQVKRSEDARRQAEDRNAQLQRHIMALNTSSQQQASRMARMEIELRRMHAVSLRHFVEKERVVSGRSLQSDDCPYARVTELLGIQGLPVHATGGDFQRHEEVCKARRFLLKMDLLERHTSKCGQCGLPYVKGPLAPHGEQQHFWHCRAESHDVAELVEEGEMLAQGQGFLLQKCLNLLSRDSEVCWFLFELLCCLARTFARLQPKNYARRWQWSVCWDDRESRVSLPRRTEQSPAGQQQKERTTSHEQSKQCLAIKEDEIEAGELRPSELSSGATVERELHVMAVGSSLSPFEARLDKNTKGDDYSGAPRAERCSHLADAGGQSTRLPWRQDEPGEDTGIRGTSSSAPGNRCSHLCEGGEAKDPNAYDPPWGRRVCVCGGSGTWERAAKRFRCGRPATNGGCGAPTQTEPEGVDVAVKAEAAIDLDSMILDDFEDDAVAANTDWVGWIMDLGALRWSFTGKTEEERRKQVLLLMCDLPLLLHALFSVCFNNCLGFTLIPEALNKENWLGEFLEAVHQCLQEVESESETTPTMWISRFFRAVEGAHKALAAIEEQRRAVNVVALERDLARRRHLLRQVEAMRDRRAAATLRAAQNGDSTSDRELQTETPEECELWREIHALSEAVKTQVSLHLNTWGQQLAHYIDTRYLRLEQYERLELCKEERLRASHQTVKQDVLEVGKYMTREQKALAVRNKRREIGANYLPYFTLRSRVGMFDDCVARIKYFAGLEGGNMPSAVNRTLGVIAQYAEVRPSTWERDVKGIHRPEVEALLQEIASAEEADRLLGRPLFEWAMEYWPQLRKIVEIGAQRATQKARAQLAETSSKLDACQQEATSLRQQLQDLQAELRHLWRTSRITVLQQPEQLPLQQLHQQQSPQRVQDGQQLGPMGPGIAHREATSFAGSAKHDFGSCHATASETITEQDPGTHPTPLLLLYCDGRSAHTVMERGDFPRIPKEVRDDTVAGRAGPRAVVSRFLLPPTPIVFEPPIDVSKSGCLYGYLPAGRTDHFTLDVVLRLPVLSSDGFRMVSLHSSSSSRGYSPHRQISQQLTSVYDPLICTRVKEEGCGGAPRIFGSNQRGRFENVRDVPYRCALLLGARYWTVSRGNSDRVQRVDLGIGTGPSWSAPYGAGEVPPSPCEQFFSFFKQDISETTPGREAPFIRVTLRCQKEVSPGSGRDGQKQPPAMRVLPFINGEPTETLTVPRMPDFFKICSIRGMPPAAKRHKLVQVVDNAVELLYVRVFSCDFDPEDLPAPPDLQLLLPGQRYAPSLAQGILPADTTGYVQPEKGYGTVDDGIEERRQQQLMLESLLRRDPTETGNRHAMGFQPQPPTGTGHSFRASVECNSRSERVWGTLLGDEQQQQNTPSRAAERLARSAPVPPFILRKRGARQTEPAAVPEEVLRISGQRSPRQEVDSQTSKDGRACQPVKGEQTV